MNVRLLSIFSLVFFISQISSAHQFKCEIYDLAYGDNLIETPWLQISYEDFQKTEPYKVALNHELVSAEFSVNFVSEEDLLFQIRTQEVVNSEYGSFKINVSQLKNNQKYELGRVFTEITGMGDNTMSRCFLKLEL